MKLTMAQALVKFLDNQYVCFDGREEKFVNGVFGIFGHGCVVGIGQALEQGGHSLTYYQGHNEQGMAHAAMAYAKQNRRRKIIACTSSIGPGALNMVTAAGTATANRIPLLLLPGDTFACRQPDPVLQQIEQTGCYETTANDAFRAVCKYWDRIARPEQLMTAAINAMRVLTDSAETGAVCLAMPQDVEGEAFDYPDYFLQKRVWYLDRRLPVAREIEAAAKLIANAKRPLLIAGGGVTYSEAEDALLAFAERFSIHDTEIWLGTINAPGCDYNRLIFDKWATEDYDYFANTVLEDDEARQYITGVSYQWGGKIAIQRTFESWWPELRLMQSENECGFGDNTWEYATYVWTMLKHYIGNGAESYMYWNLILAPWGVSTWGDPQNAMVTVQNGDYTFNPDFYVMKHFSNAVQRGAVRLGAAGHWAADALIFRNPDGSYAVEAFNPFREEKCLTVELEGEVTSFMLAPRSFNSMIITV